MAVQLTQHNSTNNQTSVNQDQRESNLDLKKVLFNFFTNWYWYLISVIICGFLAFLYLYFAAPLYKVQAMLLVENTQSSSSSSLLGESSLLSDLGISNVSNSVDNELAILKSHSLMEHIVRDMQLNITYYGVNKIKTVEISPDRCPFGFNIVSLSEMPINFPIACEVAVSGTGVTITSNDKSYQVPFGGTITLKGSVFQVINTPIKNPADTILHSYSVKVISYESAISTYLKNLSAANDNSKAATIVLTLTEEHIARRGMDMLNNLINTYIKINIEDKNRVADSTIAFINNRLLLVSDELNGIEKQIQNFKQVNKLSDLSSQAQLLVTNTNDYVKNLATQQIQLEIANALEVYLKDVATNKRVVPTNLSLQTDPNFSNLLNTYNQLQLERERQAAVSTEGNPVLLNLDAQISRLRSDLVSNIAVIKRNLQITISNVKNSLSVYDRQLSQVPAQEREFLEYSRQQSIKQEIYVFLLKQREETEIGKTANLAPVRIVDSPYSQSVPYAPDRTLAYIFAILAGLAIPTVIIYMRQILNNRILARTDVTEHTDAPVLGEISQAETGKKIVFAKESRSAIAEQFRILRTNLDFVITGKEEETRVVLVTSSMSSEGKSFIAMNLATSLSMSGKKVVLLEFDLRLPKVLASLDIPQGQGLSNYIVSNIPVDQVIIPSGVNENFFLIGAGVIPPNPAELILNKRVDHLVEELKQRFDYIIFDTPPVGLVTDAQLLSRFADASIYIVRQGFTFRHQVALIQDIINSGKIKNLNVVINGVKTTGRYGYGYGYGISNNNYGYYSNADSTKKSFFKRIFGKK